MTVRQEDGAEEALRKEVFRLEVKFSARGVKREDGLTAAEVEAELRNKENGNNGSQ